MSPCKWHHGNASMVIDTVPWLTNANQTTNILILSIKIYNVYTCIIILFTTEQKNNFILYMKIIYQDIHKGDTVHRWLGKLVDSYEDSFFTRLILS